MRINHNISSMVTQGSLFAVRRDMGKSLQKLSTGLRINTAADDAAGLSISENLRTQVKGLNQAMHNTQDVIAMLNIADGALQEQASIMQRMRELTLQALNGTYTQTELDYMYDEFSSLMEELDRIAAVTNYNGMQIFAAPEQYDGGGIYTGDYPTEEPRRIQDGKLLWDDQAADSLYGANDVSSAHHFNMFIGANYTADDVAAYDSDYGGHYEGSAENLLTIQFGQVDANALLSPRPNGTDANDIWDNFDYDPFGDAEDQAIYVARWNDSGMTDTTIDRGTAKFNVLLKVIDGSEDLTANERNLIFGGRQNPTGLRRINTMRAQIGATINRLEHSLNNMANQVANTQAAESVIRDANFAAETTAFTRNQILSQSATSMLAQSNMQPQAVLQLLR